MRRKTAHRSRKYEIEEGDYPPLASSHLLKSDDPRDFFMLELANKAGASFKCRLSAGNARDLVAKILYTARDLPASEDPKERMIPLPVSQVSIKPGRTPSEAILFLSVGNLKIAYATDLDLLVPAYAELVPSLERNPVGQIH